MPDSDENRQGNATDNLIKIQRLPGMISRHKVLIKAGHPPSSVQASQLKNEGQEAGTTVHENEDYDFEDEEGEEICWIVLIVMVQALNLNLSLDLN
ncbi:hypothetical protein TWF718_005813 [Orbilia javanica]|uniref:Uncharacterized protein n=1 Tax=Orbilia javanica TaxID=47235 RepID=A0AAN8RJQ2_9PEZI